MPACQNQKIPPASLEREALQGKGQFWTPTWLAEVLVSWATAGAPRTLFDPAVGPGTFFAAARSLGYQGEFAGFELHPAVLATYDARWLGKADFQAVQHQDFVTTPTTGQYAAIVSNPPYIRHHRLAEKHKEGLRVLAEQCLGFRLDGRAGLHVYFLLKCLASLAPNGRLAFLLPADVCEGVSAKRFWTRICERFRLEAIITFSESAAPFPRLDTNAMVFLLTNRPPGESLSWIRLEERDRKLALAALESPENHPGICKVRRIREALETGFSRPQRAKKDGLPLASFARVVRGIATGANEFFFLTRKQMDEFGLDGQYFARAIGRTRDCPESILTPGRLDELEGKGRATWLLKLESQPPRELPDALRNYLKLGERQGLPTRSLISTRRPWYKMEHRLPPPLLFAYLGRRDCRFVLNRAAVLPLTCFLCVYPFDDLPEAVERLWRALNHPDTMANLPYTAKSYGSGALKAEPRQLDQLLIPRHVLDVFGLVDSGRSLINRSGKVFEARAT